jgi:hypothetical protein
MKAKSLLAFVMCLALVLTSLPAAPFTAFAAGTGSLTVGAESAAPGEDVTVDITMGANSGIISLKFKVAWDSNALTLKSYSVEDGVANYATPAHNDNIEGQFIFYNRDDMATSNYTETGKVVSLTFTVDSGHADGSEVLEVTYVPNDIFDADLDNVAFTMTDGAINIVNPPAVEPLAKSTPVTLTAPVMGAIPETTVSGVGYSGAVSWSGDPDAFAPNVAYTATVSLTPDDSDDAPFDAPFVGGVPKNRFGDGDRVRELRLGSLLVAGIGISGRRFVPSEETGLITDSAKSAVEMAGGVDAAFACSWGWGAFVALVVMLVVFLSVSICFPV